MLTFSRPEIVFCAPADTSGEISFLTFPFAFPVDVAFGLAEGAAELGTAEAFGFVVPESAG